MAVRSEGTDLPARRATIDIGSGIPEFARGALPRLDPLDPASVRIVKEHKQLADDILHERLVAATHFSDKLVQIIADPAFDVGTVASLPIPGQLTGVLVQPEGVPADRVQVTIAQPFPSGPGAGTAITGVDGVFAIAVPSAVRSASALEHITLRVTGATVELDVDVPVASLTSTGSVGTLMLARSVDALPVSVISQLGSIVAGLDANLPDQPAADASGTMPQLTLGADTCSQLFRSDFSVDRFPYGVLVRLVEPRPSIGTIAADLGGHRVSIANFAAVGLQGLDYRHTDRVPIDQPVSVDAFRDGLAGISPIGIGTGSTGVPIAGTLGLGYIVHLAQRWTPKGLMLGDLVYSLPLAPGEQQRIAIVDQQSTTSVSESERLDVQEAESFREGQDASARATFDSGMSQSASGGSSFSTEAHSSSWGAVGGIGFALGPIAIGGGAAGGGGSSDSSGSTNNWMQGVSGYTSTAAQSSHASVERAANARRSVQRMGMRLAAASERSQVVTKVIANHNRTRALTMQYWEVLRTFDVRSTVDGVTLVCFVPLDPVRFLPSGAAATLSDDALSRAALLHRYGQLLDYASVLRRVIERPYRTGLSLLEDFAGDPRAGVQAPTDSAADVVTVQAEGTFLPYDDVWVTLLAAGGRRVGPYPMPTAGLPGLADTADPASALASEAELIARLSALRTGAAQHVVSRSIVLPDWLPRTDVVGVELNRQFRGLQYHFPSSSATEAARLTLGGITVSSIADMISGGTPAHDVWFGPDRLERDVGGPRLNRVRAALVDASTSISTAAPAGKTYFDELLAGAEFTLAPQPFAATQLPPELRYSAVLEIEKALQHVITNTATYSKAIWMSLTSEERVMLLEGFTIGVQDGVADDTQEIPLLACVANQLLGFYGNSMVLPFMIPAELVAKREPVGGVPFTTASVQDALAKYHTTAFSPPQSTIALPTHGVLGEAVLGHCPSAEKIDLTRFWNWQDSPMDDAPQIEAVTVPTSSLTAGVTAPSALTGLAPMIQNFSTAGPTQDMSLLADLIQAGAAAKGFDVASLTGSAALADLLKSTLSTAEAARKDALSNATTMATKAMDSIPDVITAKAAAAKKDDTKTGDKKDGGTGGADAPTVTDLSPTHGKVGAKLAITGTKFTGATGATVGGKALGAFTVVSDTRIEGDVPAGLVAGQAVEVAVTGPQGTSAKSAKSSFTVDS
jgi:hypothetical protein